MTNMKNCDMYPHSTTISHLVKFGATLNQRTLTFDYDSLPSVFTKT